jgi:hypothetical protein
MLRPEHIATPILRNLWALIMSSVRHEPGCAIRKGKACTCGLFEKLNDSESEIMQHELAKHSREHGHCTR